VFDDAAPELADAELRGTEPSVGLSAPNHRAAITSRSLSVNRAMGVPQAFQAARPQISVTSNRTWQGATAGAWHVTDAAFIDDNQVAQRAVQLVRLIAAGGARRVEALVKRLAVDR
jgi:hypothetical protein